MVALIGGGDTSSTVAGRGFTGGPLTITRPSNTTLYAAGDVIGIADATTPANAGSAVLEFTAVGPQGGWIRIDAAELSIALTSVTSGMTSFRLHLYTSAPTAILDNAAFSAAAGDRTIYRGYIDIPQVEAIGAGFLYRFADYVGRFIRLAPGSSSLFGVLQTIGSFAPASGTAYTITLRTVEIGK